ncbi:ATP-dependent helicase [Acetivibrio clariflavus]|uniref:DNA 3'-5' helicase n=1 Tax=Acetivibrio clariflavus (strain DSM 19732 / NBRC 101661 / EBR45) TaxID=720554 RepID=G8LSD5_ACECE|nr:ATP-dependent helicase [Acetivibrio clariflavus]AEV67196.1 DNA/RNA helicase, superfamily I [Acetivibrio clariflavus DSM 19732]
MSIDKLKERYNIKLDIQQMQAVNHLYGPALVLAGPGSGKTTVITARIAYLVLECGVKPENILTLTFNKAARAEMEYRFKKIYGQDILAKVSFSTLHSFCKRILHDYEKKKGKRLKLIEGEENTEENKRKIIGDIYYNINNSKINDDELDNLVNEIGFVKNKMIKDVGVFQSGFKNFSLIYKAYEEYKKLNLLIDFDDMLTYAYSILIRCPDILSKYRSQYSFIQVDEGQDLSKIQFEILKLIVDPQKNNIFIVADDDQSIYGFRGAEPKYIFQIKEHFKGCRIFYLENNYRSTKNIVDISSKFIRENSCRFDKAHTTNNDKKHDPFIVQVMDENEQIKYIMEKLKKHTREGRSTAILYRNNLSSIVIADKLNREGIPFRIKQNRLTFFNHWVVQDVVAFLKFGMDPKDVESFSRIYYKMNRYISKVMLEYAMNSSNEKNVIDRILEMDELRDFQRNRLVELKKEFVFLTQIAPIRALFYIKRNFNYFDYIKEYCENTGLSFEYLCKLFGILESIAQECRNIQDFLERLEDLKLMFEEKKGYINDRDSVTLTTIHSSKGLEYDVVFIVDLKESEIPGTNVVESARKNNDYSVLEEERRLFYVGMTRAKDYVYLLYPGPETSKSTFVKEVEMIIRNNAIDEVGEGMIIKHKHFGVGVIVAILENKAQQTLLEIDFNGIRRKLDLGVCLDNGLIEF